MYVIGTILRKHLYTPPSFSAFPSILLNPPLFLDFLKFCKDLIANHSLFQSPCTTDQYVNGRSHHALSVDDGQEMLCVGFVSRSVWAAIRTGCFQDLFSPCSGCWKHVVECASTTTLCYKASSWFSIGRFLTRCSQGLFSVCVWAEKAQILVFIPSRGTHSYDFFQTQLEVQLGKFRATQIVYSTLSNMLISVIIWVSFKNPCLIDICALIFTDELLDIFSNFACVKQIEKHKKMQRKD